MHTGVTVRKIIMRASKRSFIRATLAGGIAAAACFTISLYAQAQSPSPAEARQIAEDAYI